MARPVIPLAEYLINQDYIAEFLCVNKDRTELNCKGKCYLMQQLDEQNQNKQKNLPKISIENYPIGFVYFIEIPTPKKVLESIKRTFSYTNNYSFLFFNKKFHPPNHIV